MKTARVLSSILLALCGTFALSSFQQAPTVLPSAPLQQGKTMGVWQSPTPGQVGQATGILAENGSPAYRMELIVKRTKNGGLPSGTLQGRLVLPGSPMGAANPKVVAKVVGKWVRKPGDPGRFRAVLVRPNPMTGDPEVIGVVRGSFVDPPMKPGSFQGAWAIFK